MKFNEHSSIKQQELHALFSPSQSAWLNYDDEKVVEVYQKKSDKIQGTIMHKFAEQCILLQQKLPKSKKTLNQYVNDAIGFKMKPEVVLYYSENFFGTADCISFRNNELRIHDYKSGVVPAKIRQLEVYAALFCLEYGKDPKDISIELRIYQNDEAIIHEPTAMNIKSKMEKIIRINQLIEQQKLKEEV